MMIKNSFRGTAAGGGYLSLLSPSPAQLNPRYKKKSGGDKLVLCLISAPDIHFNSKRLG